MGYFVISRRIHERIQIGDNIEILISDITPSRVDVAIKAPKEIKILIKKTHLQEQKDGVKSRNKS